MTQNNEENNYPKAIAISTGIMGVLLALSFFMVIGAFQPPEDIGMGGMVVNYGTSVTGMGTDYTSIEEPSMAENANNKMPDKITPEQQVTPTVSSQMSDKNIATQDNENAVSVNTKDKKSNNAPSSAKETKAEQTINQNALYKGKKNNGSGQGDGTGDEPGNQGSINGDPLAPFYGEGGSGNGNTPLPLSNFRNLVKPIDDSQKRGVIMVKITVNRQGRITSAVAGQRGTQFVDQDLFRKCEQTMLNSSLNPITNGPEIRTFFVPFRFGLN